MDELADFDSIFPQYKLEDWQQIAKKSLRGESIESLRKRTAGGLNTQPLYTDRPANASQLPAAPLQRWDNRLALVPSSATEQNNQLLAGLNGGISSVQLTAETNRNELNTILKGVQLDIVPLSLKAGFAFSSSSEQLLAFWNEHGVSKDKTQGALNADPVGVFAATGTVPNGNDSNYAEVINKLVEELGTLAKQTQLAYPNLRTVSVDSSYYHNAGASLVQELVASLSTAAIYMQAMIDAGLEPQAANDTLVFQVSCDANTTANVVKLRALNLLWNHTATHFNVPIPTLELVVETSHRMQSKLDPWVNHLRNISAATAAAMAGAQTIIVHHHNYIDGHYIDNEQEIGARVARNVPIILSEESRMTFIHDPLGGSYAIEHLTQELMDNTWQALKQLEHDGGLVEQLGTGLWQQAIAEHQHERVERLRAETDIQVGVNRFVSESASKIPLATESPTASKSTATSGKALNVMRDALAFEVNQ